MAATRSGAGPGAGAPAPVPLARPELGEEEAEAVARVFASGRLTEGPETLAFEAEFAAAHETAHAVAFSSGTAALVAVLVGLDLAAGDEVVVPCMTFLSSATSVLLAGGRPVFADMQPHTFNLDPEDTERALSPRTRAIMAVHYAGQPADLADLRAIADGAGIPLIEDAAEAHGARYQGRPVGGFGRAAMFSFTPTKNMTMGEGGIVTTDDAQVAEHLRLYRNHGYPASQVGFGSPHLLGANHRLTEAQAAVGRVQLAKLPSTLARKAAVAARLTAGLAPTGVTPPAVAPDRTHPFMLYTVLADGRDDLQAALAERGIDSRTYFPPLQHEPLFGPPGRVLPVADEVAPRMLSLPAFPSMGGDEVTRVVTAVGEAAPGRRHP